jgi:hypothetical protein
MNQMAMGGPGYPWPESYHVTYIPGLEKFIVTASRDGADAFGCADHALEMCPHIENHPAKFELQTLEAKRLDGSRCEINWLKDPNPTL